MIADPFYLFIWISDVDLSQRGVLSTVLKFKRYNTEGPLRRSVTSITESVILKI